MRIVNAVLFLVMTLFAVVQYNDPDFLFWGVVYGVAALWAGIAAFRPRLLERTATFAALALCTALAIYGTVHYWPSEDQFWEQSVWWESESAREGMGMMLITIVLTVVTITATRIRARQRQEVGR